MLTPPPNSNGHLPQLVSDLRKLFGHQFSTVLADPPWQYQNTASRGAAQNHYETMSINDICSEPVQRLVAENAHLHLWTTNAFLEPAFEVIRAWGFEYRSVLLWIKPSIGMGNYWRVSHEFLLFGIRGKLPFARNNLPSWVIHPRESHSKKPFCFRELIEQVSPGPYLELYGRREQPGTDWTVYGNNVERRLF